MPQVLTTLQIPNYTSAPVSGLLKGQLYFNTSNNTFFYYDGSSWVSVGSGTGSGNVSNSGAPTGGQLAVWVDATHIQGVADTTKQWDGGSTGLTASTGRTSLGLVIGTNVQAQDSDLDTVATATPAANQYYGTNASSTKGFFALTPTKVTLFASSGTYTPTTGVRTIKVECVGGGGGGGGAKAAASTATTGGGGGGGGYSMFMITSSIKGSYTFLIGGAGTAGTATPTAGGNGGDTSFDSPSICTATGGGGGGFSSTGSGGATFAGSGGAGGTSTAGLFGYAAASGEVGLILTLAICRGGAGAAAALGGGSTQGAINAAAGSVGRNYGAGGSGAASNSATGFAGGAGTQGYLLITEYF